LASIVIKNWDNKNWLSSRKYIQTLNEFILLETDLNKNSSILDIGCGRGKIPGNLKSKLCLKNKPIGVDIVNHKDRDRRIEFKKKDGLSFLRKNKKRFNLILIKQTIHLLSISKIRELINKCRESLHSDGKILIFCLDPANNEMPAFKLMSKKLKRSLLRDKMIIKILNKKKVKLKKFVYKVKITKKKYIEMINDRFISTLISMSDKEIFEGINEIDAGFDKNLIFNDNLVCIVIKK
jgi:cyclopropane fatty-acyl-phospholipid synthase-like methyltransferase